MLITHFTCRVGSSQYILPINDDTCVVCDTVIDKETMMVIVPKQAPHKPVCLYVDQNEDMPPTVVQLIMRGERATHFSDENTTLCHNCTTHAKGAQYDTKIIINRNLRVFTHVVLTGPTGTHMCSLPSRILAAAGSAPAKKKTDRKKHEPRDGNPVPIKRRERSVRCGKKCSCCD